MRPRPPAASGRGPKRLCTISALVAIGTMLLAGALGGMRGERYHRRADAAIAGTGDGGVSSGIES